MSALAVDSDAATGGGATCRVCHCTETNACLCPEIGPCWWVEPDLCSHCAEPAIVLAIYMDMQRRLEAGNALVRFELPHWSKRAYSALLRATTRPADIFEL